MKPFVALPPAEESRVLRCWRALREAVESPRDEEALRLLTEELRRAVEEERAESN